ncbi:class I SAM-dependent methyltransferase [Caldichromatium japonicum]|uniref:Class I SAM-dependent methyltransferase n=1 Tax=Caldichromatium japonicum TaxID=2699430 RepID=A0A6G7VCT3_9GAMM|nr:class I SAM-dependent methyltransferase [Caldichromatium japonicum]QIK37762.1 class I SAM-dependent methyltransferase [Caldichromatium japonicum]
MKRRPEPEELMEGEDQARAYAEADFTESNTLFIRLLQQLVSDTHRPLAALDLGCGPADIVIRFLRAYPNARCAALDGSKAMLKLAAQALSAHPELVERAQLIQDCIPSERLPRAHYDLVLSNSLLHHLPDPQVLWETVRSAAKPGAPVLIMDLMRSASPGWVETLVETYAGSEPEVLKRDFRNSLYAAFEPAEVSAQLQTAGLECLEVAVVSDRHLAVMGYLPT